MLSSLQRRLLWLAPLLLAAPLAHAQASAAKPAARPEPKTAARPDDAALEQRLAAARDRLEQAAREVAELTRQLSGPAMDYVMRMHSGGARRAMIGVNLGGSADGEGVRVVSVSPGGPAAEAGMQGGDVIVAIGGKRLAGGRELVSEMRHVEPGEKVPLELRRDGKRVDVIVVARLMEPQAMMFDDEDFGTIPLAPPPPGFEPGAGDMHWMLGGFGDAEFATLTPKLGRYFGADKGVLVVRAPADGSLKVEDGDVIQSIDGREPQNGGHLLRILRSYQAGEKIRLQVLRDHKQITVEGVAPERRMHDEGFERRVHPPMPPRPPVPPRSAVPAVPPAPPAPRS